MYLEHHNFEGCAEIERNKKIKFTTSIKRLQNKTCIYLKQEYLNRKSQCKIKLSESVKCLEKKH